jgi:hypothetical protein
MLRHRVVLNAVVPKLPAIAIATAISLVAVQTVLILTTAHRSAATEGGVLDWLSVTALAALCLATGARALTSSHGRRRFALLAVLLAYLAIDDALGLHEQVGAALARGLAVADSGDMLFMLPYLPLLAAAFALLLMAARELPPMPRRVMYAGLALLVGTVAVRAMAGLVGTTSLTVEEWQKAIGVAVMNDAELAAWLLLLGGVCASRASSVSTRRSRPR